MTSTFNNLNIVFSFDVDLHRPKKARGNEKDKLPSGVEPRSNDQQTSTPDTEPRSPDKSLSPYSLVNSVLALARRVTSSGLKTGGGTMLGFLNGKSYSGHQHMHLVHNFFDKQMYKVQIQHTPQ